MYTYIVQSWGMGTFNATTTSVQKVGEIEVLDKLKEARICSNTQWGEVYVLYTLVGRRQKLRPRPGS